MLASAPGSVPPPSYRWVIVAAGGVLGCVAMGSMFSLPVFLRPIAREAGWSVTGISTAMTVGFLAIAVGSLIWGSLADRFGSRLCVLAGSLALSASLALASRAATLLQFQLVFGLAVGFSTGAIFAPVMACVTTWFDTKRSLAVSLVSAGMGMAPLTMSPLAAWLVSNYHWRTSMLVIAALCAAVMVPVGLLVRGRPTLPGASADSTESSAPDLSRWQALSSPTFLILMLTNFFCCATHSGPIFHTVSYAVSCGIPLMIAVSIYSVEGLAGLGGRIGFGFLGDRFGARRVLAIGLLVQAFAVLAYVFARSLASFYTVAALVGFVYAGVMPLYSVIIRENFPARMMGTLIGGTTMAGGFGMATGTLSGGLIYDNLGTYSWLYIGSAGMGIGAFLIALAIRPLARARTIPALA